MKFADDFDRILAHKGPPALFTMNHNEEFQFDLFRTRDWCRRTGSLASSEEVMINWNFVVVIDKMTRWPMVVLLTSDILLQSDEHSELYQCDNLELALKLCAEFKEKNFAF